MKMEMFDYEEEFAQSFIIIYQFNLIFKINKQNFRKSLNFLDFCKMLKKNSKRNTKLKEKTH